MRLKHAWMIVALAMLTATPVRADQVCDHIRTFERAKFDSSVQPEGRRWIELHWLGAWLDFDKGWGFGCRSSPDAASQSLCAWLKVNTGYEFADNLPFQILECHGYRFPRPYPTWGGWNASIDLLAVDRWAMLEVAFGNLEGEEGAIRFSSFADGKDGALVPLPPIGRWRPSASEAAETK